MSGLKVILIGGGRPLLFLAQAFQGKGHQVTIINRSAEECRRLAGRLDVLILQGDGSDPIILEESGARQADVLLAATQSDADNLIICQMASSRFAVPRTVALVSDPENEDVFRVLGVEAISTSLIVANLIEQRAALDPVMNLIPAAGGRVSISEAVLSDRSPCIGLALSAVALPREALVAMVIRGSEVLIPRGNTVLESGDRILLVSLTAQRERAIKAVLGG